MNRRPATRKITRVIFPNHYSIFPAELQIEPENAGKLLENAGELLILRRRVAFLPQPARRFARLFFDEPGQIIRIADADLGGDGVERRSEERR